MSTDAWGIDDGYHGTDGTWHATPPETTAALRAAMGADPDADPSAAPPTAPTPWIVRHGAAEPLQGPVRLVLEDGTVLRAEDRLPADLPLGHHDLWPLHGGATEPEADAHPIRLVVAPGRCHLPDDLRAWGVVAQLYAARSSASWGVGDYGDLRMLVDWSHRHGAEVLGLNPLHAPLPAPHQEPSPYSPSSRRWLSPLYLRVEDVPGAVELPNLPELVAAGRALNAGDRIDRDAVWRLKLDALEPLWRRTEAAGGPGPGFDRFVAEGGDDLEGYATFCALVEAHPDEPWHRWPEPLRHPDGPAVARFAADHGARVRFHAWLQWLAEEQLAASGAPDLAITDLAIGVGPDGADAWRWQDLLAPGVEIGAPPDEFNTQGQGWGLPPFVPWKLRAAGYEPFVQTVRAALRHGRGIRIDHVMGLFRLFWIPPEGGPAAGAYVRSQGADLLDLLALESVRAGAFVVGEDLGTVEPEVRRALGEGGVLSTKVLLFEDGPVADLPRQALATVTTHDLPTVAGLWDGTDLRAQEALELAPNVESTNESRSRLARAGGLRGDEPVDEALVAVHRALGAAPCAVRLATLDDVLGAPERPNMPGTTDQWPNWSIPLPIPIDDLDTDPVARAVVAAVADPSSP